MNNTLHLSATTPALNQQSAARTAATLSRPARLLQAIAALLAPRDDPAALRYIASKYNGSGD